MLAILHVRLPYELLVPLEEEFVLRTYQDNGYAVQVGVPGRSENAGPKNPPASILLNGKAAIFADVLPITFAKDTFDRRKTTEIDPPYSVINRAIESFTKRLRYAAKAPQVRSDFLPDAPFRLSYTNDDGSELVEDPDLVRGRGVMAFGFSWIACDSKLWNILHELPPGFEVPAWRALLLDAQGALPHIGSAITLAATSLEVFIAQVLNGLQSHSSVPSTIWSWINERPNRQNDPTVEEQFSTLLSIFIGQSLKEQSRLWEGFKNLKTARNNFVHTGVAAVGGSAITEAQAREYIFAAGQITEIIREWLPSDMRWPLYDHHVQLEIVQQIGGASPRAPDPAR